MKSLKSLAVIALAVTALFTSCGKSGDAELATSTDSISYALGAMQGSRIRENLQKDTTGDKFEAFLKGFDEAMSADDDSASLYYAIGLQVASQLKMEAEEGFMGDSTIILDPAIIKAAFLAAVKKEDTKIAVEEATQMLQDMFQKKQAEQMAAQFGPNKEVGEKFLAQNKAKKGVITTKSGLQYEIIKNGSGAKPSATSTVKVNYHGTLIDGTVFDSSVDRKEPATFPLNQVIPGWTEGIQLMTVGSKFKFYVPQYLAYGERESGPIPPFSTLVFEVELLSIEK